MSVLVSILAGSSAVYARIVVDVVVSILGMTCMAIAIMHP